VVSYVAFLRGITPQNPDKRNERLRRVFESLGLRNVQAVVSSGNNLFESPLGNAEELEGDIEKALLAQLGFASAAIILSRDELQQLVDKNPFSDMEQPPKSSLSVTFSKSRPNSDLIFPYRVEGGDYTILGMCNRAIFTVIDLTSARTGDMMSWLEKEFGKEITTRTWSTVRKTLDKMRRAPTLKPTN
jgi:uncharacterized protein (DUF1697 family)